LTCEKIYFVTRKCSKKKKKREGMNNEGRAGLYQQKRGQGGREKDTPL
jgi:hypothetical protein